MATGGVERTVDEQIESRVRLYRVLITDCVNAIELLPSLTLLGKAEKQAVRQCEKNEGGIDAMEKLLDILIEKSMDPKMRGIWSQFVTSLESADFEYLALVLQNSADHNRERSLEVSAEFRQLIDVMTPEIIKKLNPMNMVSGLVSYKVINKTDKEQIEAERCCQGDIAASIVLLDKIPRRVKDWFYKFLCVLHEAEEGNEDKLVLELDPLFLEKYEARRRENPDEKPFTPIYYSRTSFVGSDWSSGVVREDYATGYGDRIDSGNLAPPTSLSAAYSNMTSELTVQDKPSLTDELSVPGPREPYLQETPSMSGALSDQRHMLSDILNNRENVDDEDITYVKQIAQSRQPPSLNRSGPLARVTGIDFSSVRVPSSVTTSSSTSVSLTERLRSLSMLSTHHNQQVVPPSGYGRGKILLNTKNVTGADLQNQLNDTKEVLEKELGLNKQINIPHTWNTEDDMESCTDNCDLEPPDEDPEVPREVLRLRDYQMELAHPGLQGRNCIIVAPTGSGKTHVALKIIEEHFKMMRGRRNPKVIFLVEQSALADQQGLQCKQYLGQQVKVITGETQRTENFQELSAWVNRRDILVVTAQLLVNALLENDVRIGQFSLLVFDECHHSNIKHAFNRIMHHYIDLKLNSSVDKSVLPQVVGLTASVGVGKAKKKEDAIKWIEKIMAHLDAHELSTVRRCIPQLRQYASMPEQITEKVQGRVSNVFGNAITNLMQTIEKFMEKSIHAGTVPDFQATLRAPAGRGSDPYTQWLSRLWKETAKVYDQPARRFFTTCRNYLDLYNKCLIIYEDARVKDALDFLDDNIRAINERIIKDDTDRKMEQIYERSKLLLENCLYNAEQVNPKLNKLKEMLVNAYEKKEDSRGIIFVKTRDLVKAIESWMKDDKDLRKLNPVKFVGAQASIERGGMTKNEQVDVLQFFRDGKHKVIIATSVAEEGLDIQKCNLVIRYDYVTNEIAMVQSRGRGRAEDSKYILLASEGGRAAQKEEINLMREAMMQVAIEKLQDRIQNDRNGFNRRILKIQMEEKLARDMEATKHSRDSMQEGQFELRCGKCQDYICMSSDVRTIQNAHHAVLCTDIKERVMAKKLNRIQYSDQQLQSGVGKITCRKCGQDLGNVSIYHGIQFPIIKICSFSIVDAYGAADSKKKWKDVPFPVRDLSDMDLHNLMAEGVQPFLQI